MKEMTGPQWPRSFLVTESRRGLARRHTKVLRDVLEEIPRALQRCMDAEGGVYMLSAYYFFGGVIDWEVVGMRHWMIDGPSILQNVGLFQRLVDGGFRHRQLIFWLRDDGEIVYSIPGMDYLLGRQPPPTQKYPLRRLTTAQLEEMLRGLRQL